MSLSRQGILTEWEESLQLLELTSSDQLFKILKNILFYFYKTSHLDETANRTEPFPSMRVPWSITSL
jgi:hypothetical protein